MNSLKCPKSKSLTHCFTELFPFYQNKHQTIRQWNDCSVDPSSHCITIEGCRTLQYYCNLSLFSLIFAQYLLAIIKTVFYYQIELTCLIFSWSLTHIFYISLDFMPPILRSVFLALALKILGTQKV